MTTMAPPSSAPTSPTARSTKSIILVSSMSLNVGGARGGYLRAVTELLLNAQLGGPADELRLRADAELAVDAGEVAFHRAPAQIQVTRDLGRGLAAGGEQSHLAFAAAERI